MSSKQKQAVVKTSIYVAGLPRNYDTAALKMLFSVFGTISRSKVILPKDETKHAYGFVTFSDAQCAQEAIKGLNGCVLFNSRLMVEPYDGNYVPNELLNKYKMLYRNYLNELYKKYAPGKISKVNALIQKYSESYGQLQALYEKAINKYKVNPNDIKPSITPQLMEKIEFDVNGNIINNFMNDSKDNNNDNKPDQAECKQPVENDYLSNKRLEGQTGPLYVLDNDIPPPPKRSPPSPPLTIKKTKKKQKQKDRWNEIQKQIHYYFSVDNMNTDDFLRRVMDKNGWIAIDTILHFNRMKAMHVTKDEIIKAVNSSKSIEIEANHQNAIRMTFWEQYIPCHELQCAYDTIKQKYESYLANNNVSEISRLQTENETKDQLIKQLQSQYDKVTFTNQSKKLHIQSIQQKYKNLEIKYNDIATRYESAQQQCTNIWVQQLQSQHDKYIQSIQKKYKNLEIKHNDIATRYESAQLQCTNIWVQQQNLQTQNKEKDQLIKQLKVENNQLKIKYDQSRNQQMVSFDIMNKLENEHKELQMKYNELETKYNEKIKKLDYRLWDATDIVHWIIDLDKKYTKYYSELLQNMINEGIDGSCLPDLDRNDLHRLGITQFKDKRDIYENLQQLIDNKNSFKNEKQNNQQNEGMMNNTGVM